MRWLTILKNPLTLKKYFRFILLLSLNFIFKTFGVQYFNFSIISFLEVLCIRWSSSSANLKLLMCHREVESCTIQATYGDVLIITAICWFRTITKRTNDHHISSYVYVACGLRLLIAPLIWFMLLGCRNSVPLCTVKWFASSQYDTLHTFHTYVFHLFALNSSFPLLSVAKYLVKVWHASFVPR